MNHFKNSYFYFILLVLTFVVTACGGVVEPAALITDPEPAVLQSEEVLEEQAADEKTVEAAKEIEYPEDCTLVYGSERGYCELARLEKGQNACEQLTRDRPQDRGNCEEARTKSRNEE